MRARVVSIHRYPVKSGRVNDLGSARLGRHGLQYDRSWLIVDDRDRFITQRTHPALARLDAHPELDGSLRLTHPLAGALTLPPPPALTPNDALRPVRVWSREVPAMDCGPEAAAFAGRLIGAPGRIVAALDATFPDGYPLLICNAASLADLVARLPAPIPMARFRPNIVVEGWEPWAEDGVSVIRIGAARLRLVKPCTRCVITSLDQVSGEPDVDPLPTLRRFRWDSAHKGVTFGWNAEVSAGAGAVLRVGDEVEVLETRQAAAAAGVDSSSGTREVT
jgi:uncharacterized protein YcbX